MPYPSSSPYSLRVPQQQVGVALVEVGVGVRHPRMVVVLPVLAVQHAWGGGRRREGGAERRGARGSSCA